MIKSRALVRAHVVGDATQHVVEPGSFAGREGRQECLFDASRTLAGFGETLSAGVCEVHGPGSPIRGIRSPLDQMLALEFIDEMHHRRLVGIHDLDELTLIQVAPFGEQPDDRHMGDAQIQGTEGVIMRHAQPPMRAL